MKKNKENSLNKAKNMFHARRGQGKGWNKMKDEADVWSGKMKKEDYYKKYNIK
jgi:hypothetical protein